MSFFPVIQAMMIIVIEGEPAYRKYMNRKQTAQTAWRSDGIKDLRNTGLRACTLARACAHTQKWSQTPFHKPSFQEAGLWAGMEEGTQRPGSESELYHWPTADHGQNQLTSLSLRFLPFFKCPWSLSQEFRIIINSMLELFFYFHHLSFGLHASE